MFQRTLGVAILIAGTAFCGNATVAQTGTTAQMDAAYQAILAMSLGIPAVTLGGGGEGGVWHSEREWYQATDACLGPQHVLLTVLALAGVENVSQPVLAARPPH